MTSFLDTNYIIRYLVGEPVDQARIARKIIETEELIVTDTAIAEVAYVLTSFYNFPRNEIVNRLVSFVQMENIAVLGLNKNLVVQGLLLCAPSGRISFMDALIWAAALSTGAETIYSFDERFPKEGIEVRTG